MNKHILSNRFVNKVRPMAKNVAWMAGGVVLSVGVTVAAQQYAASPAAQPPCDYAAIVQKIIDDKAQVIALTSSDPDRYFNQDCLGDLAFADLDLSMLIPDPIGLLTSAATAAVNQIKQAAKAKVCKAIHNSVGDVIGQYNNAVNTVNGVVVNVEGMGPALINGAVDQKARAVQDKFNLSYNTSIPQPVGNSIPVNLNLPVFNSQKPIMPPTQSVDPNVPLSPTPAANQNAPSATVGSSIFGR